MKGSAKRFVPLIALGFVTACPARPSSPDAAGLNARDARAPTTDSPHGPGIEAPSMGTQPAATVASSASAPSAREPLSRPSFGIAGPIRIVGYPTGIQFTGNDPAYHVGFTRDGAEFGYCNVNAGLGGTSCEFVDLRGQKRIFGSISSKPDTHVDNAEELKIERWLKTAGVSTVVPVGSGAKGPALTGTWRFASDIVLQVTSTAGTTNRNDVAVAQPLLRVGGRIAGYPPVYPFTFAADKRGSRFYGAFPNGIALSPNGEEIGILAAWYGMEYVNDFKMARMSTGSFAAHVYNDTAFALHKKGAFREAAELFTKATFADETWSPAPYNLACAYAKTGDPRSETALRMAIERSGPEVKRRARGDADFDSVRSAPWFASLTAD